MKRSRAWTLGVPFVAVAAFVFSACGGGGTSGPGPSPTGISPLVLIDMSTGGNDGVPLNQIITFEFSEDLDPDTVRPDTIRIREGANYGKQVPGYYEVDGNIVRFYPKLPEDTTTSEVLHDAGLQPNDWLQPAGSDYRVQLPGSPDVATVRSYVNDRLTTETEVHFRTASSTSANLFVDNFLDPLPPRIIAVNPTDGATDVPADSKIVLTFNRRPLHPATVNTSNIRLFIESRQGVTLNRPFPIKPILTQSHDSVQIEIAPQFPIADQATYRIEVDRRVQDLVGNDVQSGSGGTFVSHFSVRDEPFRNSSITYTFDQQDKLAWDDEAVTTASWNESEPDALAALFTIAGGNGTAGDLAPNFNMNLDPTDFTRGVEVQTKDGVEYDVYNFRSINIPSGVSVRFSRRPGGPNRPVLLLSLKSIEISGTLTVSGGTGTSNGATIYVSHYLKPTYGGSGGPGGGDGGDNYRKMFVVASNGYDGDTVAYSGGGGSGGLSGTYNYYYSTSSTYWYSYSMAGGGGGGGGNRTAGDKGEDGYYGSGGSYAGHGGDGGLSVLQRGYSYNLERTPNVGGAGGAAGGNGFYQSYYSSYGSNSYQYGGSAGAGGGGGGGITLQSASDVNVHSSGAVLADGGDGGMGTSYAYSGGGGGGGAGGGIKIVATAQVNIDSGAKISVAGGAGAPWPGSTYTYYKSGAGGNGGQGYLRFEALEDENSPGKPLVNGVNSADLTYKPPSLGVFAPQGGGAPSIGQTTWRNLGVVDPTMFRPSASDVVATLFNDSMKIEVQMAIEDPNNLGNPDLSALDITDSDGDGQFDDTLNPAKVSEWTLLSNIEQLNDHHYQFIRVRVTFQLDDTQRASDPLPYLDSLRIPFGF